ncbi:hypothetical protein G3M54_03350 [Bacillus megaterium NBRC 15308 = ATCC 14581]|nr:hypothetical protein [Priestia megaterium NBRC 15308 = ATCC 14581]
MVYGLDVYVDGVSVKDQVIDLLSDPTNSSFVKNVAGLGWEPEFTKR